MFRLADMSTKEYDMGMVRVRLDGREKFSEVIFAEDGMRPLLGAVTLEEFQLAVDPTAKRLFRVEGLLMRASG